jgi:hypothetical protein
MDVFDGTKLWEKVELVKKAAEDPTKLCDLVIQPRTRRAAMSDVRPRPWNAPRAAWRLWFGGKARALELLCQREERA